MLWWIHDSMDDDAMHACNTTSIKLPMSHINLNNICSSTRETHVKKHFTDNMLNVLQPVVHRVIVNRVLLDDYSFFSRV